MKYLKVHEFLIKWLHLRFSARQFLIFSSILIGLSAGLAAVILKTLVHYIYVFITTDYHFKYQYYLYLIFPFLGILLTSYIIHFFFKRFTKGTDGILLSIIRKGGSLPVSQMYSHIITSALTVGFGGSAGLESPIVSTGSAIGSNYARIYKMGYRDKVLLLACGVAAGISAAFNAPIAGVLFALEILLVDATISAFLPLIISAAVGTLCSRIILQDGILLSFNHQESFNYHNIPFYILLGIVAGFVSVYYSRVFTRIEHLFKAKKRTVFKNALIGGGIISILILVFPTLYGEGYSSIILLSEGSGKEILTNSILSSFADNSWFVLVFIGLVMLTKVVAASITINSGGNGGNFAPSLFVGAYLGYVFSRLINMLGISKLPESNFTIVAMSGILTGVFHAPLTGIFLIAEITRGYDLIVPLMIVSAISFIIVKYFEPMSMDAKKLAGSGRILTDNKDRTILSTLSVSEVIETDFVVVSQEHSMIDFAELVARSDRNVFPVVNKDNVLEGVIFLNKATRKIILDPKNTKTVLELMQKPQAIIYADDHLHSIMEKFDKTGMWNLPVVDNGIYMGFISKSGLLARYRERLVSIP
jgi:CIC family chloride channel protein